MSTGYPTRGGTYKLTYTSFHTPPPSPLPRNGAPTIYVLFPCQLLPALCPSDTRFISSCPSLNNFCSLAWPPTAGTTEYLERNTSSLDGAYGDFHINPPDFGGTSSSFLVHNYLSCLDLKKPILTRPHRINSLWATIYLGTPGGQEDERTPETRL